MSAISIEQALQIALVHHQAGRLVEAEGIYRQILGVQPLHADSLHLLGVIAIAYERWPDALDLIQRAILQAPAQGVFHANLGEALRRMGRPEEAVHCFRQSLVLQPDVASTHLNLGSALLDLKQTDESIVQTRKALSLDPNNVEAYNNLGNALTEKEQWDEALACFERALTLQPSYAKPYANLANTHLQLGHLDKAVAAAEKAITLQPNFAEAHGNLGAALLQKGDFRRALEAYRQAVAFRPDLASAHWNLSLLLLLLGHYAEGWKEHEWRWTALSIARPEIAAPQWNGHPMEGQTLLLHAEQGFGDTIQFLRYVPLVRVRARAAKVYLMCMRPLARLLTELGGWDAEILPRDRWDEEPMLRFDAHLPLLSLPLALGIFEPNDPRLLPIPYLHVNPESQSAWRERLGERTGLRVGLAWAGSSRHRNDRLRSIPWETVLSLLQVPDVQFYSLQVEPGAPTTDAGLHDLTADIVDFLDTAALIAELDLIISVDTAAAHLAGALGKTTWLLLPFIPDWRWGVEHSNTPWYPNLRIFRQPATGDWESVIHRIKKEFERCPQAP
jgi:tetratricopeptide (TPR) repeat protein